jgi:hypothetical protein
MCDAVQAQNCSIAAAILVLLAALDPDQRRAPFFQVDPLWPNLDDRCVCCEGKRLQRFLFKGLR